MCDTLVVRGDDGILFAKNSDRDANEAQLLAFYPAATHEPGRVQLTHTAIDQARQTYAVVLSRPWWMWGAEMGAETANRSRFIPRSRSDSSLDDLE